VTAGSLPAGLTLGASTGLLSGTPTVNGTFNFTVKVVDQASDQATLQFTLVVNPPASNRAIRRFALGVCGGQRDPVRKSDGSGGGFQFHVHGRRRCAMLQSTSALGGSNRPTAGGHERRSRRGSGRGSTITFSNITIPSGTATVAVTNVRVNPTSLTMTGVPPSIYDVALSVGPARCRKLCKRR